MTYTTKRVTVKCPNCQRNVTVNTPVGRCLDHWCFRCDTAFVVRLDGGGNVIDVRKMRNA